MNTLLTNFRLNHAFMLCLVIAFLAMQWTTTHFHLAEQHDHGDQHQHQVERHAHDLNNLYVADIDNAHQAGYGDVVEIDYECHSSKRDNSESSAAIISVFCSPAKVFLSGSKAPRIVNITLSYLHRSSTQVRAPPQIS